jgi:drug/metabolite transporter (DMT)-like permease
MLIAMGAGWGATQPLAKISVSEGYQHFGLIFWQLLISAVMLLGMCLVTGRRVLFGHKQVAFYVIITLIGTVLPNSASYKALTVLPSGVVSILLSLIPMLAFPVALALGNDRFAWSRLGGLALGFIGVSLIILPDASLPERAMLAFIPLALVAPAFYAFEGNFVARWGTAGLDPVQLMCGASIVGVLIAGPLAYGSGQWFMLAPPFSTPDWALIAGSLIHGVVYTCYVWLVGRAGAVFAAQVSYLVTGFGVLWAMLILGERYSAWVWAAFGVLFLGLLLVQPRARVEPEGLSGDTAP